MGQGSQLSARQGEFLKTQGCVCVRVSVSSSLCRSAAAGSLDSIEAPSTAPGSHKPRLEGIEAHCAMATARSRRGQSPEALCLQE